uniref:Glucosylceramidase n=1 Tax=Rhabditophanes sp. KR3021 TaxID=114890 RepID=A0AC35UCB4_9BILA
MVLFNYLIFLVPCLLTNAINIPCTPKNFGTSEIPKIVCVCTKSKCDTLQNFDPSELTTTIGIITTTQAGKRFEKTLQAKQSVNKQMEAVDAIIHINITEQYQQIIGFGGAFTDSFGININKLTTPARNRLMYGYFSKEGLEYTIARVPIGSTDFSTSVYSYDEVVDDFELKNFNLTTEDFTLKIPYIKEAVIYSGNTLKLYASAWAPPAWMKTNNKQDGGAPLKGEVGGQYYETWSNYYIKFFEAYQKQGINFWGVTSGNEPTSGNFKDYAWQSLLFTPKTQKEFLKTNLGPKIRSNPSFKNMKIMILDDDREVLPAWADDVLEDSEMDKYVDGVGVHWYMDNIFPASNLEETYKKHPTKFVLGTEACTGSTIFSKGPIPGNWNRGESYLFSIIDYLNHYASGWTDWNFALDMDGGPSWAKNNVDAPILIDAHNQQFYRQPMFYALGHVSKFVKPGGVRIYSKLSKQIIGVEIVSVKNLDGTKATVILNKNNYDLKFQFDVVGSSSNDVGVIAVEKFSFTTVVWK